jgi:DNA-binding response OmpR family regulator
MDFSNTQRPFNGTERTSAAPAGTGSTPPLPQRERILVADDEDFTRMAVIGVLQKYGYRVIEARDGRQALDLALAEKPALLVLDIEMPEMGGLAVIERLRERGNAIPVLVLSGRAEVDDRVRGLMIGADDYLTKPYDRTELLARVQALLRRHEREVTDATGLKLGDLVIDLDKMEANRPGATIKLSKIECSILSLLARNEGRPVSREEMFDVVWGYTFMPETRTVDTHIWRLRKKLGDGGKTPRWIKNTPGAGYSLECERVALEATLS